MPHKMARHRGEPGAEASARGSTDVAQSWIMVALASISGVLAGVIVAAGEARLNGGPYLLVVGCGLLGAIAAAWAVFKIGYRVSVAVIRRYVTRTTLPWSVAYPFLMGAMTITLGVSTYLSSLLASFLIERILN